MQPTLVSSNIVNTAQPLSVSQLQQKFLSAIEHVDEIILGKREQVELMFVALLAEGHVLLDDTPGMGKTTLARAMSGVLGMDLRRVQFTSDLMPSDIVGVGMLPTVNSNTPSPGVFHPGPVFTHLLLADEINRASPRTQSALLEAMAERQVTVDGNTHQLPHPFWVIATQNPVDFSGTFPLPESQMDRFLFRMVIGYPDEQSEMDLFMGKGGLSHRTPTLMLSADQVVQSQESVEQQGVTEVLVQYLHRLVKATRTHPDVSTGLSPRAGLSLLRAARAHSWLKGRNHVLPEDIQAVFVHATAHRLTMAHQSFSERSRVAEHILATTSCP